MVHWLCCTPARLSAVCCLLPCPQAAAMGVAAKARAAAAEAEVVALRTQLAVRRARAWPCCAALRSPAVLGTRTTRACAPRVRLMLRALCSYDVCHYVRRPTRVAIGSVPRAGGPDVGRAGGGAACGRGVGAEGLARGRAGCVGPRAWQAALLNGCWLCRMHE